MSIWDKLAEYFEHRADILHRHVEPSLMDAQAAKKEYQSLKKKLKPYAPFFTGHDLIHETSQLKPLTLVQNCLTLCIRRITIYEVSTFCSSHGFLVGGFRASFFSWFRVGQATGAMLI